MNYAILIRGAAFAAALGAGSVLAQTKPPVDPGTTPPAATDVGPSPVVTDVGPAPAQERDSMGAIVLGDSLVRAQRQSAFERASVRTGVASVGRGVMRATAKALREADLAQARENAAERTR
ncbi:MAG TPA: hypothetical protein VN649_22230 [Ramlibacter sp.]|nr:hypothetical protein [Ramlibacter sp.]